MALVKIKKTERLFERSEFSEIEGRILADWIVNQHMKDAITGYKTVITNPSYAVYKINTQIDSFKRTLRSCC